MIVNSKYTLYSFWPLVLYEQFHQFINLFYLGLTISQFIPILKVGILLTSNLRLSHRLFRSSSFGGDAFSDEGGL